MPHPIFTPRVIFFDLDGTLVDTMQIYADFAADLIASRYPVERAVAREQYLETSGLPFIHQLEVLFPGDAKNAETDRIFEAGKLARVEHVRLDPATRALLDDLHGRGFVLAISSGNTQENVDAFCARESLPVRFPLGFKPDGFAKGEPHFRRVEEVLPASRSEMLFIGDSLRDGELAAAGHVSFIAKLGTFTKEEFAARLPNAPTVSSLHEIVNFLS